MPNSFMCELVCFFKHVFCIFYIFFREINFPARSNKNECVGKHAGLSTWESHLKVVTWKHFHNVSTIISVWTQIMKLHALGGAMEPLCLEKHMHTEHTGSLIRGNCF